MIQFGSYIAVWQPGKGGQHWHSDMDADEFQSLQKDYAKKGMHLTALDIWRSSFAPPRRSYCGVWQTGKVTQYLEPSLSVAEFKKKRIAHGKAGRRIAAFDIDEGDHICALWQSG